MRDHTNYRQAELVNKVERGGFGVLDVMVTGLTGAGAWRWSSRLWQPPNVLPPLG